MAPGPLRLWGFLHNQNERQAGGKHDGQKKEDVDAPIMVACCCTMPNIPAAACLAAVSASMPRTDKPRSWTFDAADRRGTNQCYLC